MIFNVAKKLIALTAFTRTATKFRWAGLFLATLILSLSIAMGDAVAASSKVRNNRANFDHNRTGFLLQGVHARVSCETCHARGVFKGTPKDCSGCHTEGSRVGASSKPSQHIPTNEKCETCHKSSSWTSAKMNHASITPGSCSNCHNNSKMPGKPAQHIKTSASCDTCHSPHGWLPAKGFNHVDNNVTGNCASCHNGVKALGKPASHIPTTAACETCHNNNNFNNFKGIKFNHAGVTAGCATCHNGTTALGKSNSHIQTAAACETCHSSTTSFKGGKMDHTGITTGLSLIHIFKLLLIQNA